jgi:hypothetical protein
MRGEHNMTVKAFAEILFWVLSLFLAIILNIPAFNTFQYQPAFRQFIMVAIPIICLAASLWRIPQILKEISNKRRSSTVEYLEEQLAKYKKRRPKLSEKIDTTIAQIKMIREKFRQLTEVLERNEMEEGFEYTVQIAQQTLELLIENARILLNKITICEEDVFGYIYPDIDRITKRNGEIVETFNQFLIQISNMKDDERVSNKLLALRTLTKSLEEQNNAYKNEIEKSK